MRPRTLLSLFALAFAVTVLVLGIIPINHMLARYLPDQMRGVWTSSLLTLSGRTISAVIGLWIGLIVGKRGHGVAPERYLVAGALISGAVAGAIDVLVHRGLVWRLLALRRTSTPLAWATDFSISLGVAFIVALVLVVRGTKPAARETVAEPSV